MNTDSADLLDAPPDVLQGNRGVAPDPAYVAFAQTLRENVGKWAKHPRPSKNPNSVAAYIRQGRGAFSQGTFVATVRGADVYVSCVDPT